MKDPADPLCVCTWDNPCRPGAMAFRWNMISHSTAVCRFSKGTGSVFSASEITVTAPLNWHTSIVHKYTSILTCLQETVQHMFKASDSTCFIAAKADAALIGGLEIYCRRHQAFGWVVPWLMMVKACTVLEKLEARFHPSEVRSAFCVHRRCQATPEAIDILL